MLRGTCNTYLNNKYSYHLLKFTLNNSINQYLVFVTHSSVAISIIYVTFLNLSDALKGAPSKEIRSMKRTRYAGNVTHTQKTETTNLIQNERLQQHKKWYPLRHNKIYETPPHRTSIVAFSQVSDCSCDARPISNQIALKADAHDFQSCNKHNAKKL